MNDENRELRKAGLKVTVPRLKILQLLEESGDRHMSAEDVYRKMLETGDDVSIATVYRVLTQFEGAGLITRHNFDSGPAVYEIDRGDHHDHMVNVDTGQVVEFHSDKIEALQKQIVEKHGYQLVGHNLVLYVKAKK
ncbi:ferric iron uptake transcriptional regulator [Porticoccus sp.]